MTAPDDPPKPGEPRRIGKYELLTSIGEGGMAEVFLARQRGPLDFEKVVVIKTIHPHLAKREEFVRMFLDEARIAAQISHPNVVQVFDLGIEGTTFFIAMEYLAGESLTSILQYGAKSEELLPPPLAAYIVAQAAEGLHAAHELKSMAGKALDVVHRDVSPGNIVVLYDGGVKVVDFGVAKAKGRLSQTVGNQVKGKFAYMAPEQIAGEQVDRRADIFGLGVVLWETLTAKRLYRADNDAATLQAILGRRPRPPSSANKAVPRELDDVALRALATAPAERFQTAQELQRAIDAVLPPALKEQLATWMQKHFADRMHDRRELLERLAEGRPVEAELAALTARLRQEESASVALPDASFTPSDVRRISVEVPPQRRQPVVWIGAAALLVTIGAAVTFLLTRSSTVEPTVTDAAEVVIPTPSPAPGTGTESPPADGATDAAMAPEDPPEEEPTEPGTKPKRKAVVVKKAKTGAGDSATAKTASDEAVRLFVGGNLVEAEKKFKAALAADAGYAPAHRGLGLVYERAGKSSQAVKHLRAYLKLAPGAADTAAIRKRIAGLGG